MQSSVSDASCRHQKIRVLIQRLLHELDVPALTRLEEFVERAKVFVCHLVGLSVLARSAQAESTNLLLLRPRQLQPVLLEKKQKGRGRGCPTRSRVSSTSRQQLLRRSGRYKIHNCPVTRAPRPPTPNAAAAHTIFWVNFTDGVWTIQTEN